VSDVVGVRSAAGVLMVRPVGFAHNEETRGSNRFQQPAAQSEQTSALARAEFEALRRGIEAAGVTVCVVEDTPMPIKPDAVFPNNWVSFHRDGTVVLYPMLANNRRHERRPEILVAVERRLGFTRTRLIDLSVHEREGCFLEGTGSLVLDHVARLAYACRSPRTNEPLVHAWSEQMNFEPVLFDASGSDGTPVYHTNVLLGIGSCWAVVCTQAIAAVDRTRVLQRLRAAHEVVEISLPVMAQFGANVLELRAPPKGDTARRLLVLSQRARTAIQEMQGDAWDRLSASVDEVLAVPVPTIENVGGGGVRCMLAEVPEVML
jgi:hypothetical protein